MRLIALSIMLAARDSIMDSESLRSAIAFNSCSMDLVFIFIAFPVILYLTFFFTNYIRPDLGCQPLVDGLMQKKHYSHAIFMVDFFAAMHYISINKGE